MKERPILRLIALASILLGLGGAAAIIALDRFGPSPGIGLYQWMLILAGIMLTLGGLALGFPEHSRPLIAAWWRWLDSTFDTKDPSDRALIPLLVLLLLAFLLRIYALDSAKLWTDELFTWYASSPAQAAEALTRVPPNWSPLSTLSLWTWIRVAGDSAFALRYPPLLYGLLSVALVYAVGRRLLPWQASFAATAMVATALMPLMHAREARIYSQLLCFSLLAALCWLLILRRMAARRPQPAGLLLIYGLSALASLHASPLVVFVLLVQGLALLILPLWRGLPLRMALVPALVLIAATLAGSLPLLLSDPSPEAIAWIQPPGPFLPAMGMLLLAFLSEHLWLGLIALGLGALGLAAWLQAGRPAGDAPLPRLPLLLAWLLLPPLALYLLSILYQPTWLPRYLISALPSLYLLLALAIWQLPLKVRARLGLALLVAGLLAFDLIFLRRLYAERTRIEGEHALRAALDLGASQPDTLLLLQTWNVHMMPWAADYPLSRLGSDRHIDLPGGSASDLPALEAVLASGRYHEVVLVRLEAPVEQAYLDYLDQNLRRVDYLRLSDNTEVWRYVIRP